MARRKPVATCSFDTAEARTWQVQWPSTPFVQGSTYRAVVQHDGTLQILTWVKQTPVSARVFGRLSPQVIQAIRLAGGKVNDPSDALVESQQADD